MPRDTTRFHRIDALAKDAAAIDQVGTRLAGLIDFIRHAAKDAAGRETSDALDRLAQALADTAHDEWGGAIAAHDADADDEGVRSFFKLDPTLAVTFGMKAPEGAVMEMAE